MTTLVYKRTHNGDPDSHGRFGVHDCMGKVRAWTFDAVIGVGGIGDEPHANGIAGKVNWIGIGPHKNSVAGINAPVITFDHFLDFGTDGPSFCAEAPVLAKRIYSKNVRAALNFSEAEQTEINALLARAANAPPSPGLMPSKGLTKHPRPATLMNVDRDPKNCRPNTLNDKKEADDDTRCQAKSSCARRRPGSN